MPCMLGRARSAILGPAAVVVTFLVAACNNMTSGPSSAVMSQFSRDATLPDVQNQLVTGPTRVEVSVIPGTLTARRLELEQPDQLTKPERVRGRVTAITSGTDTATLTLDLGGLQIALNGSTRLHPDDADDGQQAAMAATSDDGGNGMTLADFVARIQAELAAGRNPAVRATRPAPAQPQAPDDGKFLAATLQLDEGNNHPRIELNIAAANLTTNATPAPDAVLKVLGVSVELRVSDGTTKLRVENQEAMGAIEFHGVVKSVDQTANAVTLVADGCPMQNTDRFRGVNDSFPLIKVINPSTDTVKYRVRALRSFVSWPEPRSRLARETRTTTSPPWPTCRPRSRPGRRSRPRVGEWSIPPVRSRSTPSASSSKWKASPCRRR